MRVFRQIALAVFLVLLALLVANGWVAHRQERRLLGDWGVSSIEYRVEMIRIGMTRDEVRQILRGFSWHEEWVPDVEAPGGTEVFYYAFGFLRFNDDWSFNVKVLYDSDGRVRMTLLEKN